MPRRESADILVIGSGAAGAAVVKRLSEHGAKVVCLERGDWRRPADYPSAGSDYEGQFRRSQFSFNPNVRKRPEDYPVASAGQNPPEIEMVNAVGGTTVVWNCECLRFHPSDFQVRTIDGVARDWPIRYQDLEPFYNQYDREVGVSGLAGDPANPKRSLPLPPLPLGDAGRIAGKAFNKLGWHWWIFPTGILSRPYNGRPACDLNGRGWYGCGVAARAGTDVTHWRSALQHGAVLKTGARVSRLTLGARGRVRGALYFDQHGNEHEQLARIVVVCANGIGTPRLLLVSKSKEFPNGLANSSGLVGKGLMLHVWRRVRGIVPECIDSYLHPVHNPVFSHQFYETETGRGFLRGYTMYVRGTGGPLSTALRVKAPWGTDHHKVMRHSFPHVISVGIIGEDLPDDSNRVELDSNLKDSDGIPAPRVVYSFSENSRKMLDHAATQARDLLEAAGASEITDEGVWPGTSHLMGTARMGNNPKTSVVNTWHQTHDVNNLFLVDGSSFVTGGGVGPTPTIAALALRCADGIWERRREWV
jgi:choline dehydrogenase-like flavoprotein